SIGWSALGVAAEDGLDNIVAALIASDSSVDTCNNRQMTPLHYASQNGHVTVVKALIRAGANIQCSDGNQSTPLHSAAMSGHAKVVAVLISAGADVNSPDSSGDSPIFMAAQHGYDRIVSLLIENGADVDMQENAGDSPLQFAANHGHADVVSMLIESGAEIDLRENIGWSALHIVSQQSKAAVAEVLIKAGCQIDIREFDGWTPLHVAMLQGGPTDVVAKLIEAGANVELVDKDGWSPLHFAAAFGQFHLIELFWNPKTCQTAAGSCRQDIEFRDEFTDVAKEDRRLSVILSSAMSDAGFNQAVATLQVGSGAVLQDLIRLRCECRDFFVFGSFADGWGSSLTGIDGRIDDDSDIDITRILAGTKLHIVSSLDSDSSTTCPNECTPVRYENGHVEFLINVTRPNQMNEGSPLCPAIDEIRAHPCCNYPPVQVLQPSYRSRMPDVMLEALRGCLQNSECHAVSASPPGMAGSRMRVSTTHLERAVMQRLSTVQGQLFIVLKYLIKKVIAKQATGIKTYHAKNLLFYMLDETPKELWKPENLLLLVRRSLQLLQDGLRTVTQSRSECMRHFFLRDAAVYLRGDHQSKEVISRVVTGVLSDLPDLLAKYKSILRIQASGGVIRFHPFTILISTSDTSSYLDEAVKLPCHKIYPIIKRVIAELAEDAADIEAETQNIVENLINRLPDCARTTRECLRALMCLKFGLPLRLDAEVSLQRGSRDIHCPRDQPLSVDEAKVLIWNHLQSTDSAMKFCFKFNEKPVFEFLPCHISEAFPAPTYSYTNYFYVNFDALMKTLQLEFGLSSPSSRAALFEELLNSSEPDTQELQMALNYCQDDELLVRLVHKHRDCIAASRLFDEFLREYKSRHLHQPETSESEDSR
uniref:ANK_REP_REGION domain-containing protein n=1 Tax=Macrostomum lignano TaxID=282301 RepID=A0A1I8GXP2_9PLAT